MTIKFFSNRTSSEKLLKRFKANYIVSDCDLKFTSGEDYNFAVVFNRTSELIHRSAKVITVIQEPSWSPAHYNTTFLTNSDYLVVHEAALFEEKLQIKLGGHIIESPSYMFYNDWIDKDFFDDCISSSKSRKLSMVVSDLNYPFGIYSKRLGLLKKILASDLDIDIYGKGLVLDDRRFKGYLDYKFSGLIPYEYSIAIENSEEKNYISEKFIDCVLCNTIPIYHGAPNIAAVYDQQYFRILDLDSPTVIDDIKNIIAVPARPSTVNKDLYFTKFNLYTLLKRICLDKRPYIDIDS